MVEGWIEIFTPRFSVGLQIKGMPALAINMSYRKPGPLSGLYRALGESEDISMGENTPILTLTDITVRRTFVFPGVCFLQRLAVLRTFLPRLLSAPGSAMFNRILLVGTPARGKIPEG